MGFFSNLFNGSSQAWKSYTNNKRYGDYAVTQLPTELTMSLYCTKTNARSYLKQYNDSIRLIGTTVKPEVFFYRYDFAIKRAIALIYIKKHIRMSGDSPVILANSLIEHKQEFIRQFLERVYSDTYEKISKLKTTASIQKRIDSLEALFAPYYDEISPENREYIDFIISELRGVI